MNLKLAAGIAQGSNDELGGDNAGVGLDLGQAVSGSLSKSAGDLVWEQLRRVMCSSSAMLDLRAAKLNPDVTL